MNSPFFTEWSIVNEYPCQHDALMAARDAEFKQTYSLSVRIFE